MSKYTYTEEQLRLAIETSLSIRQVLDKLGVRSVGGNYKTIHKLIEKLKLDISHFTGSRWNRGRTFPEQEVPVEEYLSNNKPIGSYKLKLKLFKLNLKSRSCENCNLDIWLNEPIPLELDHIDGNSDNNELSNLRILCPNCHARTSTYRGKNKKSKT
jgi:5-methylcytosine-specific restriction endonuclease McrA